MIDSAAKIVGTVIRGTRGVIIRVGSGATAFIEHDDIESIRSIGDLEVVLFKFGREKWTIDAEDHLGTAQTFSVSRFEATEGLASDQALLPAGRSLRGAAKLFNRSCPCSISYENNCAHFLSSALIAAGYSDLADRSGCINARCSEKRPVRARDLWCWFQTMAVQTTKTLKANSGAWVGFQLDESEYWGGHVVIVDTDTRKYYGTGWYPHWSQAFFKLRNTDGDIDR